MVRIMMSGEWTEQEDTRRFFFDNGDGNPTEIDRAAAGMFVYVWVKDDKVKHYNEREYEIWELLN